jgi:hypothetical protein
MPGKLRLGRREAGEGCRLAENARGTQENLWPKLFSRSAPLRATSSVLTYCILHAVRNPLKTLGRATFDSVGIALPLERFTSPTLGNIHAKPPATCTTHSGCATLGAGCGAFLPRTGCSPSHSRKSSWDQYPALRIFRYNSLSFLPGKSAPLAQLDRASGYEPEGREFESLRAHHLP